MSPFKIPAPAENSSTYLGEGTHEVSVDEVDTGTSSNGNPQIIVTFKDGRGATIRDWVTITEKAMWRVQLLWEAAGLPWAEGIEANEDDLLGRRLLIVVAPEEWGGVVRNKVRDYQLVVGSDIPVETIPLAGGTGAADDDSEEIPFLWDGPREYADRYHAQRSL